jgi:hypothetical protein
MTMRKLQQVGKKEIVYDSNSKTFWTATLGCVGLLCLGGAYWMSYGSGYRRTSNLFGRISRSNSSAKQWLADQYHRAADTLATAAHTASDTVSDLSNTVRREGRSRAGEISSIASTGHSESTIGHTNRISDYINDVAPIKHELVTQA